MNVESIVPDSSISLFVKNILVFNEPCVAQETVLPFFADGYPGLMFQQTSSGLFVKPHNKQMPLFFLYGQTIRPIELVTNGSFQFIVFQLYPFVVKSFFLVNPEDLNDDCYDVSRLQNMYVHETIYQLCNEKTSQARINLMSSFLRRLFENTKDLLDFKIRQAIQLIIDGKGQIPIAVMCKTLKISVRNFERRFVAQVGVSPKQLSKIIQFDASLHQLNAKAYRTLTDIVYSNGFADQSHFIRVFKAFTGTTPKKFRSTL